MIDAKANAQNEMFCLLAIILLLLCEFMIWGINLIKILF
jgi:hypothetical protein